MSETLAQELSTIYRVFCNAAETCTVELGHNQLTTTVYSQEDAVESAMNYVEDLYEEGIGQGLDEEQIKMLVLLAVCDKTEFIVDDRELYDGRNFND